MLLLFAQFGFAQVGIGTTSPTLGYELDVDGSLLIQKEFKVSGFPLAKAQDDSFKFLLRLLNSVPEGEVTKLDLDQMTVGPINVINYTFHNLSKDNLEDVDLQFDSSKYVVGLSNVRYVGEGMEKGTWIDNTPVPPKTHYIYIGDFVARTFVDDVTKTWHLEMRNRSRDSANDDAITYHVTLIIYDRKYFKQLTPISKDLDGKNFGSATKPSGL